MRQNLKNILIGAAVGLLAFLGSEISQEIWKPFFDHLLPVVSKSWLWLLFLLSLAVNLVLTFFLIDLVRKNPAADYELVDERGFYKHKDSDIPFYCGACYSDSVFSPMTPRFRRNMKSPSTPIWVCPRKECGQSYLRKEGEGETQADPDTTSG